MTPTEQTTVGNGVTKTPIAPEFGAWPITEAQAMMVDKVRALFTGLQTDIEVIIPSGNVRYLALVKTKLEEACLFAVKGITKPVF